MAKRMKPKVRSCTKSRYRDEIAAKLALADIQLKDRGQAHEKRAYRCPICKGWHLTSQEKR